MNNLSNKNNLSNNNLAENLNNASKNIRNINSNSNANIKSNNLNRTIKANNVNSNNLNTNNVNTNSADINSSGMVNKLKNKTKDLTNKFSNLTSKIPGFDELKGNSTAKQIIIILVVNLVILLILFGIRKIILTIINLRNLKPWLIKGSRNGKNAIVLTQDPADDNSVTLYRSNNEDNGLEFSYTMWLCFLDLKYNYGKWKHIFHKGNKDAYPNRAPGLWLHPKDNKLRLYMNTYDDILEFEDIDNVPMKKWIHLGIVVNQKIIDIYFNGKLRKRKILKSLPRQNFGDVWINMYGGFDGYLSKFRYYKYSLEYNNIEAMIKEGPSKDTCGDTGEMPPYLDEDWWFDV